MKRFIKGISVLLSAIMLFGSAVLFPVNAAEADGDVELSFHDKTTPKYGNYYYYDVTSI